ncbi:MAG: hypothetical protein IJU79_01615 [Desulfovibrionaceae bacterium]|nr:hypothetical protein [Desulfovibrionaceae bacterium]
MADTLILGSIAKEYDPKLIRIAGPWCLPEELLEEAHNFKIAPEPFAQSKNLELAIAQTKALCQDYLPKIVAKIAPESNLPASYWEFLLLPWLALVAEQIIERWSRIQLMMDVWGKDALNIEIVDVAHSKLNFATEETLMLQGILGIPFNHLLFSTLLSKALLPKTWKLITVKPLVISYPAKTEAFSIKRLVKHFLSFLYVPHLKGFSLWQSLRFSWALRHPSFGHDKSQLLQDAAPLTKELELLKLPGDLLPFILQCLPASIKSLKHPKKLKEVSYPRLRLASISAYEDCNYRQRLARWRGAGNRIGFVQHGGNYGQIRYPCRTALVEYSQHVFLTWGWHEYAGIAGNFKPIPYPQLTPLHNAWCGANNPTILFIGTEMPLFGYRLDSHPTPWQIVDYRSAKLKFFKALPNDLVAQTLYRPYFTLPGTLKDWDYVQKNVADLKKCQGPLEPQMLKSRLLILDHHGTTWLQALVANIPHLLFWNKDHWPLTDYCNEWLQEFKAVGIWFATPEACAKRVAEIYKDIPKWWQTKPIQRLRRAFCAEFAETSPNTNLLWLRLLKKL